MLTADYDYWLTIDDIETFNAVAAAFDLHPTRTPADARRHGRYVLENDEHIDILVDRSIPTIDGLVINFDYTWKERMCVEIDDAQASIPSIDALILTKQIRARPKDLEDIRLLRILKESGS